MISLEIEISNLVKPLPSNRSEPGITSSWIMDDGRWNETGLERGYANDDSIGASIIS
jgi:hypothetical protein